MTTTDTTLYRSLHKSDFPDDKDLIVDDVPAIGILYPRFEAKTYMSGGKQRTSAPDVEFSHDEETGETSVKSGGGTSLWDKDKVFKGPWRTFTIPGGTIVPDSLKVKKGRYDSGRGATHYQIEVRTGQVEITVFKGALDNFARNAVVRAIELSKGEKKESV